MFSIAFPAPLMHTLLPKELTAFSALIQKIILLHTTAFLTYINVLSFGFGLDVCIPGQTVSSSDIEMIYYCYQYCAYAKAEQILVKIEQETQKKEKEKRERYESKGEPKRAVREIFGSGPLGRCNIGRKLPTRWPGKMQKV